MKKLILATIAILLVTALVVDRSNTKTDIIHNKASIEKLKYENAVLEYQLMIHIQGGAPTQKAPAKKQQPITA